MNLLSRYLKNADKISEAIFQAQKGRELAYKINYKQGIAESYNRVGLIQYKLDLIQEAAIEFEKAIIIWQELKEFRKIADCYFNLGVGFKLTTKGHQCLKYYLKALTVYESIKDTAGLVEANESIGSFYYDIMMNYKMAEQYYNSSLHLLKISSVKTKRHYDLQTYIGMAKWKQGKTDEGIILLKETGKWYENNKMLPELAYNYNAIGMMYYDKSDYTVAENYFLRSFLLNKEAGNTSIFGIQWNYLNLGKVKIKQRDFNEALSYINLSLDECKKSNFMEGMRQCYDALAEAYEGKNDTKNAFVAFKKAAALKDSLYSVENSKKITEAQINHDLEQEEIIRKLGEEKKEAEFAANSRQQKLIIYSTCGGLILTIALFFISFRSYRQKKKANTVLEEKNNLISEQKQEVEEKQKEILDSIRYAKRIQKALLPSDSFINKTIKRLN